MGSKLRGTVGFLVAVLFLWVGGGRALAQIQPPPPGEEVRTAIDSALQGAIADSQQKSPAFLIAKVNAETIDFSSGGGTALLWLAARDPQTGELLGDEPGLAIGRLTGKDAKSPASWKIILHTDPAFANQLTALPPELLSEDMLARYLTAAQENETAAVSLSGYKLPWAAGLKKRISGSIGHFLDYNSCSEASCRYAYDFADGTLFPLLAAKGGTVVAAKDSCPTIYPPDRDSTCTNYLTLRDDSTSPVSYQLYYHLAGGSIPDTLTPGTPVVQGQFIGNVDNTGWSSGHHLHFHVFVTPTAANYYWGNSVQIRFDDVHFNGGEPRTCAETINHPGYGSECSMGADGKKGGGDDDWLLSENQGAYPPGGSLSVPAAWTTITTRLLDVSGTAYDSDNPDVAKVQVLANYDGAWKEIAQADHGGGAFYKSVDLCAAGVPDGPLTLAVRIWDREGNRAAEFTGARPLIKNFNCGSVSPPPPPACTPGAGEKAVALYAGPGFSGACKRLYDTSGNSNGSGYSAADLGSLNNAVASIQFGNPGGTCATLYERDGRDPKGRLETLSAADGDLTDNRIGAASVSSVWVGPCTTTNTDPAPSFPGNQYDPDGNPLTAPNPPNPKSTDSLVLSWTGGERATTFSSTVGALSLPAANVSAWSTGNLAAGSYTWDLRGYVSGSSNGTSLPFNVDAASLPSTNAATAPTLFDMNAAAPGWSASGLWRQATLGKVHWNGSADSQAWVFNDGTDFSDATYRAGDLTSPPITLPNDGKTYYLRFQFFSDVEGRQYNYQTASGPASMTWSTPFWDQRRVQIAEDGASPLFKDLWQLSGDVQGYYWMDSPAIALTGYNGKTIRLRWHFDAVDALNNSGLGWAVDNVSLTSTAPDTSCADNGAAQPIAIGGPAISAAICPAGDVDDFTFSASAGTGVLIDLDARALTPASRLDSFLSLIGPDGTTILAENDDENPDDGAGTARDSKLAYAVPETGTYTLRVRAWNHPTVGGPDYNYTLRVLQNSVPSPDSVSILRPVDANRIPVIPFLVEAAAADSQGGGIRKMDFYWHSADWTYGSWIKFASDTTSADGWWSTFNPVPYGDLTGSAFYFMATNNAGGTRGAVMTNLKPDLYTPSSDLLSLPASVNSTAVELTWTAGIPTGQIDHFEIEWRAKGTTPWSSVSSSVPGTARSIWFVGSPGEVEFRMRAVSDSGTPEPFPDAAETSTRLDGACTGDAYDPGDAVRGASSSPLLQMASSQERVLCQNDVDTLRFDGQAGVPLDFLFVSLSGGAAVDVSVFDSPTATVPLYHGAAGALGRSFGFNWTPPANGTYYLEIHAPDARLYGQAVRYRTWIGSGTTRFLPYVGR